MRHRAALLGVLALVYTPSLIGCRHRQRMTLEMQWANDSELVQAGHVTTANNVCLRFVEAPDFFECLSAPGVAERLHAFEKPKVLVDFDITCDFHQVVADTLLAVDGRPVGIVEHGTAGSIGAHRLEYPFSGACQ